MKTFSSALLSNYIIDGVPQALSPLEMLNDISIEKLRVKGTPDIIADENPDPELKSCSTDAEQMHYYLNKVLATSRTAFPSAFSASYTKNLIAWELIGTLWRKGNFRLSDLALTAQWEWDDTKLGSNAAFYSSCAATAEYIDALGIRLQRYSVTQADACALNFKACVARCTARVSEIPDQVGDDASFGAVDDASYGVGEEDTLADSEPRLGRGLTTSDQLIPEADSWIIFIPFDTCEFRLGGSLFSEVIKGTPDTAPETGDADYFIDCYELVRELSEDGILLSAGTVGEGGLLAALRRMSGTCGAGINLADIKKTSNENDSIRILFSEVPGAVIQIRDIDFDYIDAEMLLQDIVYFPLGHPDVNSRDITVTETGKSTIESILDSLIRSQSSEGED